MSGLPARDIANDLPREDIEVEKTQDRNIDNSTHKSGTLKDFQTIHVQLEVTIFSLFLFQFIIIL